MARTHKPRDRARADEAAGGAPAASGGAVNYQVLARIRDWDGLPPFVSASARATLANLAAHGNSEHEAWPSLARIASGVGRSVRQIERDLDALLAAGLLRRVRAANTPGAEHRTARYRLGPTLIAGITEIDTATPDAPALRVVPRVQTKAARRVAVEDPPGFADLWAVYPNGNERQDAVREFRKLAPDAALLALILDHVKRRARSPQWTDQGGKYVPSLRKFLYGKRWTDEIKGVSAPVVAGPSVNAWQQSCAHSPRCGSSLEHQAKLQHREAVAR